MAQSKILLDSNSYFRLAKSIHPLLDVVFGDDNYCLYVLEELDDEFSRSRRLRDQFSWVADPEYASNRKKRLTLSRKERREIDQTIEYLTQNKMENLLGVSPVDIQCLAYGHVLGIPVVTDDGDMLDLANAFGIYAIKTLHLMEWMLSCGHIDMTKVHQVVGYWAYIGDKPGNFRADYQEIFGEDPPA